MYYWYKKDDTLNGPFQCPECQKIYAKWRGLSEHTKRLHNQTIIVKRTRPPHLQKQRRAATKKDWKNKKKVALIRQRQKKLALDKIRKQCAIVNATADLRELRQRGVFGSSRDDLVYANSTIPGGGKGLFANRNYQAEELITIYEGKTYATEAEKATVSKNAKRYALDLPDGGWLVGLQSPIEGKGLGSFINRINTKSQRNCRLQLEADGNTVVVITTKKVCKGTEFLTCYKKGCQFDDTR